MVTGRRLAAGTCLGPSPVQPELAPVPRGMPGPDMLSNTEEVAGLTRVSSAALVWIGPPRPLSTAGGRRLILEHAEPESYSESKADFEHRDLDPGHARSEFPLPELLFINNCLGGLAWAVANPARRAIEILRKWAEKQERKGADSR